MRTYGGDYGGIVRPLSHCIHFVRNDRVDLSIFETVSELRRREIACAYVRYRYGKDQTSIPNDIGNALKLDHRPYGERLRWVRWLDDLGGLSHRANGLVIVVDNADVLLESDRDEMFDLIEAFLTQFHDWFERKKPCHLCFQMEKNESVASAFGQLCGLDP